MTSKLATPEATTPADNTPGEITPALRLCCALAWKGNPLAGLDVVPSYIRRVATTTLDHHTDQQLLAWRSDPTVAPGTWELRWRWALKMTRQHYPDTPGLDTVPGDHTQLPLPAAA